jgi:hypothetical protein
MSRCDLLVDTTGAALWTTPEIAEILDANETVHARAGDKSHIF